MVDSKEEQTQASQEDLELEENQKVEQEEVSHEENNEANEWKDRCLRAMADIENMKKRHEKEKADLLNFGQERLMLDLLPVLDSFAKALPDGAENSDVDVNTLAGFELVYKQLYSALSKHGLEEIQAKNQEFDPNVHQAIQKIEADDVDKEMVHQEFAKGYTLKGRLIRASMVSVSTPKSSD